MNKVLHKHILAALCATPLFLASSFAQADEAAAPADAAPAAEAAAAAPAEPAAPYSLTYNLGLYSSYVSRGNNWGQTPALQGGVDWAHTSGFYLGAWFSTTNPQTLGAAGTVTNVDPSGNPLGSGNHVETDWYGGYTHAFGPVTLGVGGLYVWYPEGEKSYHNRNQDTFEGNINASAFGFTYTFSHAFTDWYGIGNTRTGGSQNPVLFPTPAEGAADTSGAEYHEFKYGGALPFAGLNLAAKVGYQRSSDICLNQKDYLIGLSRNFSMPTAGKPLDGFTVGLNYTGTFGEEQCSKNTAYYTDDNGVKINGSLMTLFIKRSW